jgi:hypothetical protein
MQCIIDRFEGEYAIVEYYDKLLSLPKVFLPEEAREGDVLDILITLDDSETHKLKKEIKKLMDDVWE